MSVLKECMCSVSQRLSFLMNLQYFGPMILSLLQVNLMQSFPFNQQSLSSGDTILSGGMVSPPYKNDQVFQQITYQNYVLNLLEVILQCKMPPLGRFLAFLLNLVIKIAFRWHPKFCRKIKVVQSSWNFDTTWRTTWEAQISNFITFD